MIINTNFAALNTLRQLGNNEKATQSSLAKLSSGLRINGAADDAAGLAISEKMRGQISGLNKATSNAQDGISMVATAEGSLNETTSILQRMRELAVQASSDTNTTSDRVAMQTEMNQLTSEVNRIGNTTEFNTQKLLQGDGKTNLTATGVISATGTLSGAVDQSTTEATQTTTMTVGAAAADTASFTMAGQTITLTFTANNTSYADDAVYGMTGANTSTATAKVNISATAGNNTATTAATDAAKAVQSFIDSNDVLKGNYVANTDSAGHITISALKTGTDAGADGTIGASTADMGTAATADTGATTYATQSSSTIDFSTTANTVAGATALVGKGITINGTELEFYDSSNGAYSGSQQGIDISSAITATAGANAAAVVAAIVKQANVSGVTLSDATGGVMDVTSVQTGTVANSITTEDGGVQKDFQATFQIGANTGQTMTVAIKDMRSQALNISGTTAGGTITASNGSVASLTAVKSASNGSDNINVEYTLDVSTAANATAAISVIDDATAAVSAERSNLGAVQNRLEHTINNLGTSSQNITTAEGNIRDVDMAKEMTAFQKNNILQQAAQSMLAQANQQGQGVLKLLQ
ncbi:flagellin [Desulfosporosinus sp. OT]|uniref:flagellin N-terminal helical domain-containing protein n=1 Tax=Desulfosporosinus sp. OT TaxID=913865 RepID=UPI000223A35D|nr:flagellin [Desulfosporosinus sp. OT]EGW36521.1 flagellin [Desulfosporosinus sp. OT]